MTLRSPFSAALFLAAALSLLAGCSTLHPTANTRTQRTGFIDFTNFSGFTQAPGTNAGEVVLTSPELAPPIDWDELVVSWNVKPGTCLKAEARGIYPDHPTKYYTLSLWSDDPPKHPRESVARQRDDDGNVKTDTLILSRPGPKLQLRLTLENPDCATNALAACKYLGVSFCDSRVQPTPPQPNRAAWGKALPVPERRQMDYEGGGGWCSPTSLSSVLAYWGDKLKRPELNHTVPEVAHAIHDEVHGGTGNWPFNTAYAGEFPGLRAYVTRFNDLTEIEDWTAAGFPVIMSVSSYLSRDRTTGPDNGHLIVCVGFTEEGDVVVNDPGVSVTRNERPRRIFKREKVINAWKKSKNAVYLVYPETSKIPPARSANWEAR